MNLKEKIENYLNESNEKVDITDKNLNDIKKLTAGNLHSEALLYIAKLLGIKKYIDTVNSIVKIQAGLGYIPDSLVSLRKEVKDEMLNLFSTEAAKKIKSVL